MKKLDTFHLLDGIEINANLDHPIEVVRLGEYATHLKANNLRMQVHVQKGFSNCYDDYVRLSKYIHIYGRLAETLQDTLRITFHPVEDQDETRAIYKTLKLISKINALIAIYQYDISFSLENLSAPRLDRVGLHTAIEKGYVGFCWDIGGETTNLYSKHPDFVADLKALLRSRRRPGGARRSDDASRSRKCAKMKKRAGD